MPYVLKNLADKADINTGTVLHGYNLDKKRPIAVATTDFEGAVTGATGTFESGDTVAKVITVTNGIITSIV